MVGQGTGHFQAQTEENGEQHGSKRFSLSVMWAEPRASYTLGKCSVTKQCHQQCLNAQRLRGKSENMVRTQYCRKKKLIFDY